MFDKKRNDLSLIEHRLSELEKGSENTNKSIDDLNSKYARKLVETIVFGAVGAILVGFITSVAGGGFLKLLGG